MTPAFADTSFYLALFNPRDRFHQKAVELSRELNRRTVTTEFVLLEVANALCGTPLGRERFFTLWIQIVANPAVAIVPASHEIFERGIEHYRNRRDKSWSLTDCISFVVMEEHGLTDALTADHHFQQAGFIAMLA